MTSETLKIKKTKKGEVFSIGSSTKTAGRSGKALVARLRGVLSKTAADRLERNINESCEQTDDRFPRGSRLLLPILKG